MPVVHHFSVDVKRTYVNKGITHTHTPTHIHTHTNLEKIYPVHYLGPRMDIYV